MHVLSSGIIGCALAIGCAIFSEDRVMALLYSPLVVSATIVALGFMPERQHK